MTELYTKIPYEGDSEEIRYSLLISPDHELGNDRILDVERTEICGGYMAVRGFIYLLKPDGSRSSKGTPFSIACGRNSAPYVMKSTGEMTSEWYDILEDESRKMKDTVTTRYRFLENILPFNISGKIYTRQMEVIEEMEIMFIKNADENQEFDN